MSDEIKEYLDDLREGGTVNMYEAPRLLQQEFGLDKTEARAAFKEWADSFGEEA